MTISEKTLLAISFLVACAIIVGTVIVTISNLG